MRLPTPNITLRQLAGGALLLLGVAVTAWLGVLSSGKRPLSASGSALLVLVSAIFNLGGAWTLRGSGRADSSLARASVFRLLGLATRAQQAESLAQDSFETEGAADMKRTMGVVAVHLSYLEEGIYAATFDWRQFHDKAVAEVEEKRDAGAS